MAEVNFKDGAVFHNKSIAVIFFWGGGDALHVSLLNHLPNIYPKLNYWLAYRISIRPCSIL